MVLHHVDYWLAAAGTARAAVVRSVVKHVRPVYQALRGAAARQGALGQDPAVVARLRCGLHLRGAAEDLAVVTRNYSLHVACC